MTKKISPKKSPKPTKKVQELAIRVNDKKTENKKDTAADRKAKTPQKIGIKFYEAGSEGIRENAGFITEAYNAQLYWPGVQPLFSRLRRSMPEMVMIRNAFTAWSRNVRPIVELPDDPSDDDKAYQDFLESDFENMQGGFATFVDTLVNHVPFMGWGWWEAVPAIRDPNWNPPGDDEWRSEADDGFIGFRTLAWRDSSTFDGWFMEEPRKKLKGLWQQDWPNPRVLLQLKNCLHITFGDPNNPEGLSPLEAVWRKERMKFGYEVVHGIGSEHAAGHLSVKKDEDGVISDPDRQDIEKTANNLMSAQEGNYAYWPFGLTGEIIDVPFSAAGSLLDMIKHLSIEALALYDQQWIALNTMTNTGAQASQVDSTDSGVFFFNSMMDGFAGQYDQQIGKRLFGWNRQNFPGMTKRPKIKFSHIDRAIALNELSSFIRTLDGILPMTDDDFKEVRRRSGFLPVNVDVIAQAKAARAMDEKAKVEADAKTKAAAVDTKAKPGDKVKELGGPGSGNAGHAGRDAENLRGGSVSRAVGGGADLREFGSKFGKNKKENIAIAIEAWESVGVHARLLSSDDPEHIRDGIKKKGPAFYWETMEGKEEIVINTYHRSWKDPVTFAKEHGDTGDKFYSSDDPARTLIHEYAHWLYGETSSADHFFINNHQLRDKVTEDVGKYAASNSREFVAEVYTGIMTGREYSDYIMSHYNDYKVLKTHKAEFGGSGSGNYGHAGRDAENLRGGSVKAGQVRGVDVEYSEGDSSDLIAGINSMEPDLKGYIAVYTADEYKKKNTKVYLAQDKRSGYGINPDGELISVFSLERGRGQQLMESAVKNGALYLDCYEKPDTKKLVVLYGKYGFVETERLQWDDQYAPEKWNYEKNDNPDVVMMRRQSD